MVYNNISIMFIFSCTFAVFTTTRPIVLSLRYWVSLRWTVKIENVNFSPSSIAYKTWVRCRRYFSVLFFFRVFALGSVNTSPISFRALINPRLNILRACNNLTLICHMSSVFLFAFEANCTWTESCYLFWWPRAQRTGKFIRADC